MRLNNNNSKLFLGQSLVEVVIALALVVLLAMALITTSLITQRAARSARNNTQATKLAQEGIERMRIYRDRKGFALLPIANTCYILNATSSDPKSWTLDVCPLPTSGETITLNNIQFLRQFAIFDIDAPVTKKRITVTVSWTDAGGTLTVNQQTILSLF